MQVNWWTDSSAATRLRDGAGERLRASSGRRTMPEGWLAVSPSSLSDIHDCDCCAHRRAHGLNLPRGKFPTLPGGVDVGLKQIADLHRLTGKLPELWGHLLPGRTLFKDPPRAMTLSLASEKMLLTGIPDEWVIEKDKKLSVLDYKTRGFPSKKEVYPSYQSQLDVYAFMAQELEGYPPVSGRGYLLSFVPEVRNLTLNWQIDLVELEARPKAGLEFIRRANKILRGPFPPPSPNCKTCNWLEKVASAGRYR